MDGSGLEVYRGSPMRGRGLGGVLGSLARFAIPKLLPMAASVGRSLLKAGVKRLDRKLQDVGTHKRKRKAPMSSVSAPPLKRRVAKKRKRTKRDIFS